MMTTLTTPALLPGGRDVAEITAAELARGDLDRATAERRLVTALEISPEAAKELLSHVAE